LGPLERTNLSHWTYRLLRMIQLSAWVWTRGPMYRNKWLLKIGTNPSWRGILLWMSGRVKESRLFVLKDRMKTKAYVYFPNAVSTSDDQLLTKLTRKHVHVIKSTERDETTTLTRCFNAEGSSLPPYCPFKGVNKEYNQGRHDATRSCSRNENRVFIR
jgi:hypothetical protein